MEIIKNIEDTEIEEQSLEELREKVLKLRELTFNKQGTKEWLQDYVKEKELTNVIEKTKTQ